MHFKRQAGDKIVLDFSMELSSDQSTVDLNLKFSMARKAGETPVLTKRNTLAGGADTEILATTFGQLVQGKVFLQPNETRDLLGEYEWDLVSLTAGEFESTVATGTFGFTPRVSRNIP